MDTTEKIKITRIGRKQQPSKFKPGETYSITTLMDDKGRKLSAMGKWAEGWKEGDVIEAIVEMKTWTDKDGFEQTNLSLKNPNQQTFSPRGSMFNPLISAYQIAATLAPLLFASKKKVMLKDVDDLAEEIRKRLSAIPVAPVAITESKEAKMKEINVDAEETAKTGEEEDEEDEDRPF